MGNIAFTRVLKINGRLWEFNFRKLQGDTNVFHTDFTSEKGERIQFYLEQSNANRWTVRGNGLPAWISSAADQLASAVEEYV